MCEAITRRGLLGLLGLAALGVAAPSLVSQSAQAQPAVVVPPPTGTERRVERRIARTSAGRSDAFAASSGEGCAVRGGWKDA